MLQFYDLIRGQKRNLIVFKDQYFFSNFHRINSGSLGSLLSCLQTGPMLTIIIGDFPNDFLIMPLPRHCHERPMGKSIVVGS